jgi:hypothetical protein
MQIQRAIKILFIEQDLRFMFDMLFVFKFQLKINISEIWERSGAFFVSRSERVVISQKGKVSMDVIGKKN